jgi:hypothetical protein
MKLFSAIFGQNVLLKHLFLFNYFFFLIQHFSVLEEFYPRTGLQNSFCIAIALKKNTQEAEKKITV